MSSEKSQLLDYYRLQRRHVLGIVDGLSADDLHRSVLPSGWSPIELLHHLAVDVEEFWFARVMAGRPVTADDPITENAWHVDPSVPTQEVVEQYRRACDEADRLIESTPLDTPPGWWPDFFGDSRMEDLREVILHCMVETAAHAGHLDVVRELIDGRQWMVLEGD